MGCWLVVEPTPLKIMKVKWDDDSKYLGNQNMFQTTKQIWSLMKWLIQWLNVGIAILKHPPFITINGWDSNHQNGWFIIGIPT